MYEYVALFWTTPCACEDKSFVENHGHLREDGWAESIRAPCWLHGIGGACIMRRPKDEPRKGWTERGELQRRNEELQGKLSEQQETICAQSALLGDLRTMIDEMVRLSNPLVTKEEESNG